MTIKQFAEHIAQILEARDSDFYATVERYSPERDPNGAALGLSDCVLLAEECRRLAAIVREEAAKLED
ncbi:MAG: hypothetical protein IOC75_06605 [Rhodobacter sp.]|nr:hypothetical protein [Rhodobacter sp.]